MEGSVDEGLFGFVSVVVVYYGFGYEFVVKGEGGDFVFFVGVEGVFGVFDEEECEG